RLGHVFLSIRDRLEDSTQRRLQPPRFSSQEKFFAGKLSCRGTLMAEPYYSCMTVVIRLNVCPEPSLHRLPGAPAGRPRPLKIIPAQPAGDVDDLADEIKARHRF